MDQSCHDAWGSFQSYPSRPGCVTPVKQSPSDGLLKGLLVGMLLSLESS